MWGDARGLGGNWGHREPSPGAVQLSQDWEELSLLRK